jgi:tetratricopeptide (TPR) repeat protein
MYFEAGDKLRDAAESYAVVPENASPSGDEALLGMAWTWAKAGQPQQALQRADKIISLHPRSPFVPEAHLLRGYSLMLLKRYNEAVPAFERALETASSDQFLTDESVAARKVQFDRVTDEFVPVAERIKRNAFRKPTPRSLEERPELQKGYEIFAKENKEFFEYRVLAKHHKNFFMRKEDIIDDATFALARATVLMRRHAPDRGAEKIDDEIEMLKRQLQEEGQ